MDLHTRDPHREKTVICLMDGEKALRAEQHEWLPRAIGVLDIWHVLERVWLVAHCFHAEGSQDAAQFVEDRLKEITLVTTLVDVERYSKAALAQLYFERWRMPILTRRFPR